MNWIKKRLYSSMDLLTSHNKTNLGFWQVRRQ